MVPTNTKCRLTPKRVSTTNDGSVSFDVDRQRAGYNRQRIRPDNEAGSHVHISVALPIGKVRTHLNIVVKTVNSYYSTFKDYKS